MRRYVIGPMATRRHNRFKLQLPLDGKLPVAATLVLAVARGCGGRDVDSTRLAPRQRLGEHGVDEAFLVGSGHHDEALHVIAACVHVAIAVEDQDIDLPRPVQQ